MKRRPDEVILRCVNLYKHFLHDDGTTQVLRGLNLDLKNGEVIGIVGVSGSGKTTLLKLIAGLEQPNEGYVEINGQKIKGPGHDRVMLFQDETILPWKRIIDNVLLGFISLPMRDNEQDNAVRSLLKNVGLFSHLNKWPDQLSGGERRRAELARALAAKPSILLLDEPFSSVDAITRESLYKLTLELWQDRQQSVILATHDLQEASRLADRILILSKQKGIIVFEKRIDTPRHGRQITEISKIAEELKIT